MSDVNDGHLQYFLYARKSEENEDRQVQSIGDQINRLTELSRNLNLRVKEIFTEAKSAKKPYNRPIFSDMMKRIEKGEAHGILCWQINRLSRNPVDSGMLSWLLQQGIIKCIQTIDRKYLPDDNVILFSVESSVANQFIIDLRKNCRRGMEGKAERGWLPSRAPLGYLNSGTDENRTIVQDKARFKMVRKMWDLMLTGNYTPKQIQTIANDLWGFRTPKHKKCGNKELSLSLMYRMFSNIFYAGIFEWGGKTYSGKHKPMVTVSEFERVQQLLGRKGNPRSQVHEFAYTGLIHCAQCGSMYTATEKTKLVKSSGQLKTYTYYHCTKKKKNALCKGAQPLTLDDLEQQIETGLLKYVIRPEFLQWGLACLDVESETDKENDHKIYLMCEDSLKKAQKEMENLTRMRYRELIDDTIFVKEKTVLALTIAKLKQQLTDSENHSDRFISQTKGALEFLTYAHQKLINGTLLEKREVLNTIGSNHRITYKKLFIEASEWLKPIEKQYPSLLAEFTRLELNKNLTFKGRNGALATIRQRWCSIVQEVRTCIQKLSEAPTISLTDYRSGTRLH